jgi:hypothetical protein
MLEESTMKLQSTVSAWLIVSLLAVPVFAGNIVQASSGQSLLRHFVAFKYKETATKQQIHEIEESLQSLKSKIPHVVSIEWGANISPEQLNKGFTDGFLITFRTKLDRDAYLVHPAHLKFKEQLSPLVADVFVLDFCDKR